MASLVEWEKRLTPFFNQNIRIIGEIPLSEADMDEILDLVRDSILETSLRKTTTQLVKLYPHTFLTMLAHFAMFNDSQGYWTNLADRLGVESLHTNVKWHQWALALIQGYGLFHFSSKDMDNFYVATVRFHGGIPTYSLPDFFNQMVIPAITRVEMREQPPKELLPYLVENVYFVDKPVLDFLANAGEMGVTWFEECCQLARHAKEYFGELLPKEDVPDLPLYIYQFFEKYNEGLVDSRYHWRRPYLQIAPYDDTSAVILNLPQQVVPMEFSAKGLTWRITWVGLAKPILRPCQMKRLRQDTLTGEDFYPVPPTARNITISIHSPEVDQTPGEEHRRWTLPLLPFSNQPPVIAFREDKRHIANPQTLPDKPQYLLTPRDVSIVVEGDGMMTLAFPELPGDWVNWKLEAWDLSDALDLILVKDGVPIGDLIPVAREMAQSELVGGHPFDYQENPDQPLYTSGLPLIQIPVRRGLNKHQALAGWSVHIVSPFDAVPNVNEHISLQNQSDDVDLVDDKARFPLSVILGQKPAGVYDIKISGPKGLGSEHRVRLWPKLLVKDLSFNFPDPKHAHQDYQFELHLQEGAYLENQAGAERVEIIEVDGSYLINAPYEVYRVRLDLVTESDKGHKARVPVSVPLPRLRWALAEEKTPGSLTFGHEPLHISTSRFEQYHSSALYFEMHSLEEKLPKLKCQLVEVGDGDQLRMEGKLSPVGFIQDRLRVPLRPFSTTIQEVDALMQFELVYQHSWNSEPIRYPVLTLTPQLAIRAVDMSPIDETSWRLTWEAEKPLKNRRVMIKSLWQPWQAPLEFKIPDKAGGEYVIKDIALPPSHYAVYFYVLNPWSEALTEPPEGIEAHAVQLCSAEARLAVLGQPKADHDAQFKHAIEKACIYDSLCKFEARDQAVSEAAKHLRHLNDIKTLVGSIRWIQNKDIKTSFKSFFTKNLFNDQLVCTMLDKYPPNNADLRAYLHLASGVDSIYLKSAKLLLDRVDDPVVMSACLKALVRRKDQDLVNIMVAMMEAERLSVDDALTYLLMLDEDILQILAQFDDPDWSPFEWSHYREPLISKYLGAVFDEIPDKSLPIIKQAMVRAAWFEISQDRIHTYLKDLIENNCEGAYLVLIDRHLAGIIDDRHFISLITLCPEKSIEMLTDESNWWGGHHPMFVEYLEEEYPYIVKALHPGLVLKTPFGIARIEKIIGMDGKTLEKAKLTDEHIRVEMVEGEGLEEIKVTLDFTEMELDFWGKESVWRCECCQAFVHPDQNRLFAHHRQAHPGQNHKIQKVKATRFLSRDDIQYLTD